MKRTHVISFVAVTLAALSGACGGNKQDAKAPDGTAQPELSAMDELKAIPEELGKDADALTKPIDDANAAFDELGSMPARMKIDAKQLSAMARVAVEGGEIKVDAELPAEARAEIEATLRKLQASVALLKETPGKAAAVFRKATEATARVPLLATRVTTQANLQVSNPFAGADSKAKAQADIASVQKIQADVSARIGDTQKKMTEMPGLAAQTLAKVTSSFAGAGAIGAAAKDEPRAKAKKAR